MADSRHPCVLSIEFRDRAIPAGVMVGSLTLRRDGYPRLGDFHYYVWQLPDGSLIAFPNELSAPRAHEGFDDLARRCKVAEGQAA